MKKYKLLITFILFGYTITNASILTKQSVELAVGSNPVSILENPSDGMIHIFCAGIDANDNNVYDDGEDEKPSWWTYNPTGSSSEANKVKEFENYFVSPFKPTIDTIKGYTTLILPFAASKTDGVFTGNGFAQGFQTKTFVSAFKVEVTNGEYLYYERQLANTISVVRVNGNDSLIVKNELNNQVDAFELNGDVIEYATFFDEDDSQYFAPLYFDGDSSRIAVFELDKDLNVDFLIDSKKPLFDIAKDSVASYTSNGKQIFITSNINKAVIMSELNEEKNDFIIYPHFLDNTVKNNHTIGVTEDIHIISSTSKDLIVTNLNYGVWNIINEMHHLEFDIDYINFVGNKVYIASAFNKLRKEGRIAIFDFINQPIQDSSIIAQNFVSYQPLGLFRSENGFKRLYTICSGIDFNFDGIINEDEGDIPASNSVHANYIGSSDGAVIEYFDFNINSPLKTNMNKDDIIMLPSGNKVYYYNADNGRVIDSLETEMYVSCAFSVLDYLVIGQRDYVNNKSYVRITKSNSIDTSAEVGANVIDCLVYQNDSGTGIVSLSEGNLGKADSKINIIKLNDNEITENIEINVGDGGISIVPNFDNFEQTKAAVVMYGSHEIHILNLLTGNIDLTFSTGTSGFGGPRDAVFYNDNLFVTTYSNQVMMFDVNTGKKLSSINIDGNSEGIANVNLSPNHNYLLVANNSYSDFEPCNRIYSYNIDKITSVEETKQTQQTIRVYPHPVANDFHLVSDDLAGTNDIAIINSQGKIVATHSGSSNGAIALNADALGLVAGNYTAVINGTRAVRFVVIK